MTTKRTRCRHPMCPAILTDPVSIARGYGPDHDPDPHARRTIHLAITARRSHAGAGGPDLLDLASTMPELGRSMPPQREPHDLLTLLEHNETARRPEG